MLVGVPLGVASRRGGKSAGFVLRFCWCLCTTSSRSTALRWGTRASCRRFIAVWSANIIVCRGRHVFAVADGDGGRILSAIAAWIARTAKPVKVPQRTQRVPLTEFLGQASRRAHSDQAAQRFSAHSRRVHRARIRHHVRAGAVRLCAAHAVFTFFDLVGDILRNHIALAIVGEYLLNLTPSMLYLITPLAVLIAALVTFGVLNRNSEIIAMKATGISLYRLVIPIVAIAAAWRWRCSSSTSTICRRPTAGRRRCAT
jgi:hypothetical protein